MEESQVFSVKIIKVFNGFVIVGPKTYVASDGTEVEESMKKAAQDVLEEFNKPKEKTNVPATPTTKTESTV